MSDEARKGTVYLVGAGPGDPGLITVRGLGYLRSCDVLVYDRLAPACLVEEAPPYAIRVFAGKGPGCHVLPQAEVNRRLVEHALAGRAVVRLKGGDPFVFGRGGEEAQALRQAGVPFEVVPGVSSVWAVPAYAGIPLTDRRCSSSVAVVTGHDCAGGTRIDWAAAARLDTVVVLMAGRKVAEVALSLMAAGRDPSTPLVGISQGTLPQQTVWVGTLEEAARERPVLDSPALLVAGEVVGLRPLLAWFEGQAMSPVP